MPATTKTKGEYAELMVACDLIRQGHKIAIPFGEDWDYDLIACRAETLERIQVKYTESDGAVVPVKCRSHSLTNGKVRRTKKYTASTVDWIAVYDRTSDRCYYVPALELAEGRSMLHLRIAPTKNHQRHGLEPAPFALQTRRSSN
jgi:PD-(D/E)XK endonuclease